jgi:hypothetical protein
MHATAYKGHTEASLHRDAHQETGVALQFTHTHTYIHTYTHARTHARTHAHTHTHTHTYRTRPYGVGPTPNKRLSQTQTQTLTRFITAISTDKGMCRPAWHGTNFGTSFKHTCVHKRTNMAQVGSRGRILLKQNGVLYSPICQLYTV